MSLFHAAQSRATISLEDAVLDAARRDERGGFEQLFELLAGPVTGFVRTRGADDPEGMANSVLYAAFSHLDSFEGDWTKFRAYTYRIARNKLIDEHRMTARRPSLVDLTESAAPAFRDDFVTQVTDRDYAIQLLEHLTEDQREVLLLRTAGGLSIEETAESVGKTINATKQLQLRAVRAIQRAMNTAEAGR